MRIALLQFVPTDDPARNTARLIELVDAAAADGADLVLAPEGSLVEFLSDTGGPTRAAQPLDGPFATAVLDASARHGITVAAGSFVPASDGDGPSGRVHNSLLVAQQGRWVAEYRKIHLYDAFSHRESESVAAGTDLPPVIEIGGVRVGFATCYDLRFPELFRTLVDGGAQVLAVAAAWVKGPLKEEHWLTLLRARAIENTAYVVAADQAGKAGVGRTTAFDPAGLQLLDLGAEPDAVGTVVIDPDRLDQVRQVNPALTNRRLRVDGTLG